MATYKALVLYVTLIFSTNLTAGDDPCGATLLDTDAIGSETFDNGSSSASGVGDHFKPDTWFSFVMPGSGELPMAIKAGSMTNPAIAIYSGDCSDPKLIYWVTDNNCDGSNSPVILFDRLNPGEQYFIRVWAQNGSPNGTFGITFDLAEDDDRFNTYADAVDLGPDCYQLTQETTGQHGCAWFEKAIDFAAPFTHVMTANFGDLNSTGADGICLVYQTAAADYCGGSGQGIGAEGMPNSVIIEFDTWQNTILNDPSDDHCAINMNGNMNHNASIAGPITLANIEDGLYHTIEFNWDPTTNGYQVLFDGILILSGNSDFVNNAFGGETDVWWGYTSSTGASVNNQIICPVPPEPILLGTQEYQEIELCEGEEYLGYTQTGFYIEFESGADGCMHQVNVDLTVYPQPIPSQNSASICENSFYNFNGDIYTESGQYSYFTTNDNGCDSMAILDLEVLEFNADIILTDTLNCKNTVVDLTAVIDPSNPIADYEYEWDGPEGYFTVDQIFVSTPGLYILDIDVITDDLICQISRSIEVVLDTTGPTIPNFQDIELTCDDNSGPFVFSVPGPHNNVDYQWYFNNNPYSDSTAIVVSDPGVYLVEAVNNLTGCNSIDTVTITSTGDIPELTVSDDTLTCSNPNTSLNIVTSSNVIKYLWTTDGDSIANVAAPVIDSTGIYTILVTTADGCTKEKELEIFSNTESPQVSYINDTIPCDVSTIEILAVKKDSSYTYHWDGPDGYEDTKADIEVTKGGTYLLEVTDPNNGCITLDTVLIADLGDSPVADIQHQNLDCITPSYEVVTQVDDDSALFSWILNGQPFSDEKEPNITDVGTYSISVTSVNGCESIYSFEIVSDMIAPTVSYRNDTIQCDEPSIDIIAIEKDITYEYSWNGPDGYEDTKADIEATKGGIYLLEVTDPKNGCITLDTVLIKDLGDSPVADIQHQNLDCITPQYVTATQVDDDSALFSWEQNGQYFSNEKEPQITESGNYIISVTSLTGCESTYSFTVESDMEAPTVACLVLK